MSLANRYEFVLFFDVKNGNPNGDPDAGNMPRLDPETNRGLVSDVCLKRKLRNYVELVKEDEPGFDIYIQEKAVLNHQHQKAYDALEIKPQPKEMPKDEKEARELTQWMCSNFFDVRTFGAVMTTAINAGQVRGPIQLAFSTSVDPVIPLEISITRMAVTTEAEAEKQSGGNRTMGRKHVIPYGLYRVHGFVSAKLAQKTGFSESDLELIFTGLENMFEHDRAAARGEMASRKLYVFKHDSELGNAPAHKLFELIQVERVEGESGSPAQDFSNYAFHVDRKALPDKVELIERL